MAITQRLASFPSGRREGPPNFAQNPTTVTTTGEILALPEKNSRSQLIIRNVSTTNTALIYHEAGDDADAMPIGPQESIAISNVKNAVYAKGDGGAITLKFFEATT